MIGPAALPSRPVRVLHLRDSPWLDGPARTILESAEHFDPERVDYHVAALMPDGVAQHEFVAALEERGVQHHRIVDRGGFDRALLAQILALVDEYAIDILHCSDFRTNVFGLWCRTRRPLKMISTAHGWIANSARRKFIRLMHKATLRCFDDVIAVSAATRDLIPGWWVPPRRIHVLHNALVVERYGNEYSAESRQQVSAGGEIRILNVGRLSPEKAQGLLLQALAEVRQVYPRTSLQIAGIGPEEGALNAQVRQLGLEDAVRFTGYVADMPSLYANVDLVVQSSLTEGLPNVILEAAFLRVPVIATAVGGTAEIIEHGVSGVLIQPGSVQELRAAILDFIRDPDRHLDMARGARKRIETDFTMAARTARMTAIYERMAGR